MGVSLPPASLACKHAVAKLFADGWATLPISSIVYQLRAAHGALVVQAAVLELRDAGHLVEDSRRMIRWRTPVSVRCYSPTDTLWGLLGTTEPEGPPEPPAEPVAVVERKRREPEGRKLDREIYHRWDELEQDYTKLQDEYPGIERDRLYKHVSDGRKLEKSEHG